MGGFASFFGGLAMIVGGITLESAQLDRTKAQREFANKYHREMDDIKERQKNHDPQADIIAARVCQNNGNSRGETLGSVRHKYPDYDIYVAKLILCGHELEDLGIRYDMKVLAYKLGIDHCFIAQSVIANEKKREEQIRNNRIQRVTAVKEKLDDLLALREKSDVLLTECEKKTQECNLPCENIAKKLSSAADLCIIKASCSKAKIDALRCERETINLIRQFDSEPALYDKLARKYLAHIGYKVPLREAARYTIDTIPWTNIYLGVSYISKSSTPDYYFDKCTERIARQIAQETSRLSDLLEAAKKIEQMRQNESVQKRSQNPTKGSSNPPEQKKIK